MVVSHILFVFRHVHAYLWTSSILTDIALLSECNHGLQPAREMNSRPGPFPFWGLKDEVKNWVTNSVPYLEDHSISKWLITMVSKSLSRVVPLPNG